MAELGLEFRCPDSHLCVSCFPELRPGRAGLGVGPGAACLE